jgi:hypothetical protein
MEQIMVNHVNFTIFDDGNVGIDVVGPMDMVAVESLEYVCNKANELIRKRYMKSA